MAVTIYLIEWNGIDKPSDTPHDNSDFDNHTITAATNMNFGSTDSTDVVPASAGIVVGDNSFSKGFKLQFSGSFTSINNVRCYKQLGDYKTGEEIIISGSLDWGLPTTSTLTYPAIGTNQDTATYIGLGDPSDLATHSRTLPRGSESVSSPGYYSGSRTDLFRIQLQTTASTPEGNATQKTITFFYDKV